MTTLPNDHSSLGHFEAEVTHVFLPRCEVCGGSHPLARKGSFEPDVCPDCGAAVKEASEPVVSEAAVTGGVPRSASLLFSLSKWLHSLAKKV